MIENNTTRKGRIEVFYLVESPKTANNKPETRGQWYNWIIRRSAMNSTKNLFLIVDLRELAFILLICVLNVIMALTGFFSQFILWLGILILSALFLILLLDNATFTLRVLNNANK